MSTQTLYEPCVDSLGFSEKYPTYYFKMVVNNGTKYIKASKINDDFTLPKQLLNKLIPIKISDTEKYDFIPYQCALVEKLGLVTFTSKNYLFLNKYCFGFVECFENDNIYYVYIKKIND
jgi:hypothetical protein